MKNKVIIFGSIFVIIAGVLFLIFWRSHVMGPGARTTAGGLVAVSADGTPMPPPNSQVMGETIPENTAIQEASDFLVSLKLDPYPPSVSNFNGFEVSIKDVDGQGGFGCIHPLGSNHARDDDATQPVQPGTGWRRHVPSYWSFHDARTLAN